MIAFAVTVLAVCFQTLDDPGLTTFLDRTIAEQLGRDSPFSVWGQDPRWAGCTRSIKAAVGALALLVAFLPRRRDLSRSPRWERPC